MGRTTREMRLRELLGNAGALVEGDDLEVTGIAIDSRRVRAGDVFFALAAQAGEGARHVAEAVARGARAVVAANDIAVPGTPVVRIDRPRQVLGEAAARLAGDPSARFTLVGVTGTNGKTTTTYILEAIWRAAGFRPGVVGTIAYRFGATSRSASLTTPDAPALQGLFAAMAAAGTTHVAMEVSSHALAQERVAGARFDAAVFTNLTRDHLDFHGDLERYYAAKARLFLECLPGSGKPDPVAIVNVDDPLGARLLASLVTRGIAVGTGKQCDVRPLEVEISLAGTLGVLDVGGTRLPFTSRLVGAPHVENMLVAAATAWALGVDQEVIAAGLAAVEPPPGRLEQITGPGFTVMVDYAHTPDALARALDVLRPLTAGRLIVVFGCGGDRDRGKRPLMGDAAARRADLVVLTSDNPRTEDPLAILVEIEAGIRAAALPRVAAGASNGRGYVVEPDRRAAIALGLGMARPGDLVLIAGKGHEDYQIVGTEKRPFDDRQEVRRAIGDLS